MELQSPVDHGPESTASKASAWTSTIEPIGVLDNCVSYRADLFYRLAFVCRLALSSPFHKENEVAGKLEVQRDRWITEYEERDCALTH